MRLGQTSIIYFISKVIGSLLGFLATVYITRSLGETIFCYYSLTLNLALWLGLLGNVGVSSALIKRVSEGEDDKEYITSAFIIVTSFFILTVFVILLYQHSITEYVGVDVSVFIIFLLFVLLYRGLTNAALKGYHLAHIYAPLTTVKIGIRSVAQILAVFLGFGLAGILTGYAIGGFVVIVLGLIIIQFRPAKPSKEHIINLYDFAKYSWLGSVRGRAFSSIDILVLGAFVQTGLVGVYTAAWTVSKFLDLFGEGISTTLFPEMSKKATEKNSSAVAGLTEDALSFAGLILLPGIVGSLVIGDRLLLIFGENFDIGATVLVILVAALLVYTYVKQLLNTLNAVDRPDLAFRANGAFIVTNVVLNFLLVYLYGWIGAAVATALSAAVGLVFAFHYTRRLIDFTVPYGEIGRQWAAALLMGGVVYGARAGGEETAVATYNEVFVVLLVTLGAGVYFLTYLAISTTFRDTVRRNLLVDVPGL